MEKSHQTQPLFSDWNITVSNSKSNIHRSKWRLMSFERAHLKSAQPNHGLILIGAHNQNFLARKLTKIKALFSDWKMTVQNSKYDVHHLNWRSMSHEPLLQISDRSAHRRSWIGPLMKSRQWRKKLSFSLFGGCKKNKKKKKRRGILILTLLYKT